MIVKKPSVHDLLGQKGKRKFLEMHVDDELEAAAAEEAGIEILTCEVDEKLAAIRKAAPMAFIQVSCPQSWICSPSDGIRRGFEALEQGADAFYFAGSLGILEAMAREGIPVTGHIGLVPRWATWTNFRAVGKAPEEAAGLYLKMKELESAGAWAVEIEVVPVRIAAFLSQNTSMLTEGMGCGTACDTQYLFSSDVLGTNTGHYPRHSKKYADLAAEQRKLQNLRISAIKEFVKDVRLGVYPGPQHEIEIDEGKFEEFLNLVGSK